MKQVDFVAPLGARAARHTAGGQPDPRLRVAVFVDHDIVYRHFVRSGAFNELVKRHEVRFYFPAPGPGNKRFSIPVDAAELGTSFELIAIDQTRLRQWRRLFQVSQLKWRSGAHGQHLRRVTRYLIGAKASRLYGLLGLPGVFAMFQWWSRYNIDRLPSSMALLLDRVRPNVMIHPSTFEGYFINDLVLLGRQRGIPTVAIMNSWDNPSTKRVVVDRPDWVLVWGPQTRTHAIAYMGMTPERAVSFGAAQLDIYRRPARVTRAEYCRAHGIDPAKRLLLYAGSSKGTDEFGQLCLIDQAIDQGELAKLAVLYRPHPWGNGGYKGERILEHPWRHVVIENSMRDYLEAVRAGRRGVFLADYADVHDVLSCVDALVSPLSTILLEAALHGKPVLCVFPEQKPGSSFDLQARHVHFEDMYNVSVILKAHGESALIAGLKQLVARIGDGEFAAMLRACCAHFVTPFDEPFSARIVKFVEHVARATADLPHNLGATRGGP